MLEIINQLENAPTVEESLQVMLAAGSTYGGIKYEELAYIETLTGTWWDSIESDPRLLNAWVASKDPIDKSGAIWKVKDLDGNWIDVCLCAEIIGTINNISQYSTDLETYTQVSRDSAIDYYSIIIPLIAACDLLWKNHDPESESLAIVVCEYVEKHKVWLKKTDYEFELYMNADNYRHAGEVIDCWSQCTGIEIENPTGMHVARADWDSEGWRRPRVQLPSVAEPNGKSHGLPDVSEYRGRAVRGKLHKDLEDEIQSDQL